VYEAYAANTIDLNKVSHLHWVFAIVCGTQCLCRGSSVRTNQRIILGENKPTTNFCALLQELRSSKFEKNIKGKLPCDDPHFPGCFFLEACDKDKTHKLSVSNHTVFNERRNRRLLAHPDDPLSAFVLFENLESIKHPDQAYIFTHELGEKRKVELRSHGLSHIRTHSTKRIGVTSMNKVRKLATLFLHKLKTQSLTRLFQFSKLFNKLIGF
jgi:hypothetical protein